MDQMAMAELIQSELKAALLNSDEEAIKRFSLLISEKISKIESLESEQENNKSDIRLLIETIKQGLDTATMISDLFKRGEENE